MLKRLFLLSAVSLCFLLDLIFWQGAMISLSRLLFYILLCSGTSFLAVLVAGLAVLMQTFIGQGIIGADLVIMVPLALVVYYVRQIAELGLVGEAFVVVVCLFISYVATGLIL